MQGRDREEAIFTNQLEDFMARKYKDDAESPDREPELTSADRTTYEAVQQIAFALHLVPENRRLDVLNAVESLFGYGGQEAHNTRRPSSLLARHPPSVSSRLARRIF